MLTKTFSVMIIYSFCCGLFTGNLEKMGTELVTSLNDAVMLVISLCGMMCFWTGLMNVLREAGALKTVSKMLRPVLKTVFGSKLSEGALENLTASFSANFLGLGNAALPLGIGAVKELHNLSTDKEAASDELIMFCVLNTVPFQLIPSTLIALRTKYGSVNPFDVVPYIWVCSCIIIAFSVVVCRLFSIVCRR